MRPMANGHGPKIAAAAQDSTRTSAASVSESSREPSAVAIPVSRATRPSTASSRNAAVPNTTTAPPGPDPAIQPPAVTAAQQATTTARPRVTRSAGVENRGLRRRTEPAARAMTAAPAANARHQGAGSANAAVPSQIQATR